MSHNCRADQRRRVAQEAAELLYSGQEKEYRQAKLCAAEILGVCVLPSNVEVAMELDRIAGEREGKARGERLVELRRVALRVMRVLEGFSPVLVGSAWRGTAHRNSDVDVVIFAGDPKEVVSALRESGYIVAGTEARWVTVGGVRRGGFHVFVDSPLGVRVEVVVRGSEDVGRRVRCEIYGDVVTGLSVRELEWVLREDPRRRFLPV